MKINVVFDEKKIYIDFLAFEANKTQNIRDETLP